jgi:hypothetical protein
MTGSDLLKKEREHEADRPMLRLRTEQRSRTTGLNREELDTGPGTQSDAWRGKAMTETMWRCDQVRAGQLYNRVIFNTREEAEEFMTRMRQMEPDQAISVEEIEARKVWN